MRDKAAENFVERYRTSHHNNILGTPKKISCRNAENESGGIFLRRCEKNEEKEGEGGRKKKGRGKGGRKKGGGKISFFTGGIGLRNSSFALSLSTKTGFLKKKTGFLKA